jgi:hypothetical protein
MLTKADKFLIGILLVLSFVGVILSIFIFPLATDQVAEVTLNGKLIKTIPLKEGYQQEFRVGTEEEYNIIKVENGHIWVEEANCPDQVCVRTGWISHIPQQIVCLPYRMVIKIVSSSPSDIDEITR